ncbi:MAG: hypothetical protein NVS2B4_10300 [Ramlibacter sp.]
MKTFELNRDMLGMTGQFYPTGHIVMMLPDADAAQAAGKALVAAGLGDEDISLITPEAMMSQVVRSVGSADAPLPSAGTEADTVRRYAQYASQGHYGLLVRASDNEETERVMTALRGHPVSHAQRYRMLVIEDLA